MANVCVHELHESLQKDLREHDGLWKARTYDYRKKTDEQVKETINQRLVESGEKERLKETLRQKLVECGWRDEMRTYCKELIRTKGIDQITVEDLVEEITPKGRAAVPDSIKADMLARIRLFLETSSQAPKTT
ncbi:enhancer of yellow 2-like [Achlya hypogyna]|uniref:Transcription and mRNA export factor ENY2 n=1 Tax=Achlya hypogyna TaxID=1202772 RepID=A0A1V9YWV7_ACHHY|nr:enhancer of yellow 2-like [Achlya hypogyna]